MVAAVLLVSATGAVEVGVQVALAVADDLDAEHVQPRPCKKHRCGQQSRPGLGSSNGVELSARGRIPSSVVEQYRAAGN